MSPTVRHKETPPHVPKYTHKRTHTQKDKWTLRKFRFDHLDTPVLQQLQWLVCNKNEMINSGVLWEV